MRIPSTMRGVQLVGHGGPDMLVWNDAISMPTPEPDDVVVKVAAAGVNNTDINTRVGWYSKEITNGTDTAATDTEVEEGGWSGALKFPLIQGGDLCGEVVQIGKNVTEISLGMRVTCPTNQPCPSASAPTQFLTIGSEFDGAFAQYCKVSAAQLYDVSRSPLTDVEIAALPCAHGTAFNLLQRAQVGSKDRVLVTGASGGVGLATVELAKLRGAHVTAVASLAKQEAVINAGADILLDRGDAPAPASVTTVIDVVGGPGWPDVINALEPGGRYAASGAIAGPIVEADMRTIYLNDLTIFGCSYTSPATFAELVKLINDGKIKPLISKTYPLADIAIAQEDFASKKYPGKLVLVPPEG